MNGAVGPGVEIWAWPRWFTYVSPKAPAALSTLL